MYKLYFLYCYDHQAPTFQARAYATIKAIRHRAFREHCAPSTTLLAAAVAPTFAGTVLADHDGTQEANGQYASKSSTHTASGSAFHGEVVRSGKDDCTAVHPSAGLLSSSGDHMD